LWLLAGVFSHAIAESPPLGAVHVADFLPSGHATNASVSYQSQIQRALDSAAGRHIVFPPMTYLIDDPQGLRIRSGTVLWLEGATFRLAAELKVDGQVFRGEEICDVTFHGGSIQGQNSLWPAGVNIRGVLLKGECRNIRFEGMSFRDLSSNGIGIFSADSEHRARDVWLLDTIMENCCNNYGDYQAPAEELHGPEKGSTREDQGAVAFYFVDRFVVRGCQFAGSRSDGTHFYRCRHGQVSDNRIFRSKMGGYFLETCEHVLATNNVILENGSRGVTIERGCRACTLIGNTIEDSGREGLWMPDSRDCIISNNAFLRNGRKENGTGRFQIWDANITMNETPNDPSQSATENCVVSHNLFETAADQVAAIRVDTEATVRNIVIEGNILFGENQQILVEGEFPDRVQVIGTVFTKHTQD
jgi:parallel beta-helix repeat protein